jgi:predicted DNA-binding protein
VRTTRLTKRLTIRISDRLAKRLADAAQRVDQDESAYIRELLRRELLQTQRTEASESQP